MKKVAGSRNYPPIIFFYQSTVSAGETFFQEQWPEARAVSDEQREFYQAFELKKGSFSEVLGAESLFCGLRAASKGHLVNRIVGDVWQMPGLFLVKEDQIVWQHDFRHVGDHPDFSKIADYV